MAALGWASQRPNQRAHQFLSQVRAVTLSSGCHVCVCTSLAEEGPYRPLDFPVRSLHGQEQQWRQQCYPGQFFSVFVCRGCGEDQKCSVAALISKILLCAHKYMHFVVVAKKVRL